MPKSFVTKVTTILALTGAATAPTLSTDLRLALAAGESAGRYAAADLKIIARAWEDQDTATLTAYPTGEITLSDPKTAAEDLLSLWLGLNRIGKRLLCRNPPSEEALSNGVAQKVALLRKSNAAQAPALRQTGLLPADGFQGINAAWPDPPPNSPARSAVQHIANGSGGARRVARGMRLSKKRRCRKDQRPWAARGGRLR